MAIKNLFIKTSLVFISIVQFSFAGADPLANYLWHLGFTGFPGVQSLFPGHINLGNTHNSYRGSGVNVVISDGRIDINHPDLTNGYLPLSRNYANLPAPYIGNPTSNNNDDGHGTSVMGIVGATRDNTEGGFGVAPDATLIGFNFIDSSQSTLIMLGQSTLPAAHVFNYSWGYNTCMVGPVNASYLANLKKNSFRYNQNYVTAAGNDFYDSLGNCGGSNSNWYLGNSNFDQSKSYPWQIVVASSGQEGYSAYYSTPGSNIWITAPGGDADADGGYGIFSTDLVGCNKGFATSSSGFNLDRGNNTYSPNCRYALENMQGTSFASPVIAGVVALMKSANPSLSWRDIKHILAATATQTDSSLGDTAHPVDLDLNDHIYLPGWLTNSAGYKFHNWYGFGLVNAGAAVTMAANKSFDLKSWKTTENKDGSSWYKSSTLNLNIPDNSATGISSSLNVNLHDLTIEHVQIKLNITHTRSSDLGIELTSPSGTKSRLTLINSNLMASNLVNVTLGTNAFYGERSKGNWTLKVVDGYQGATGKIVNWSLIIHGNNSGTRVAIATPSAPIKATFKSSTKAITFTAAANQTNIARYEVCVKWKNPPARYNYKKTCDAFDWHPAGLAYTLSHVSIEGSNSLISTLKKGSQVSVFVKAINNSEVESSVKEFVFTL